jgi:hypothetical protein
VYGLTHLDEWKWETWEAESRAKQLKLDQMVIPTAVAVARDVLHQPVEEMVLALKDQESGSHVAGLQAETAAGVGQSSTSMLAQTERSLSTPVPEPSAPPKLLPETLSSDLEESSAEPSQRTRQRTLSISQTVDTNVIATVTSTLPSSTLAPLIPISSTSRTPLSENVVISTIAQTTVVGTASTSVIQENTSAPAYASTSIKTITTPSSAIIPTIIASSVSTANPPPPPILPSSNGPPSTGGENIYRVIMNRLAALEANVTLYGRFVDAHATGTREALRRITEDVGRLNSAARTNSAGLKRAVEDAAKERQRAERLERMHAQLTHQLAALAQDVRHEKTLGVAQLVLVLAVLVFLGLTRGTAPPPPPITNKGHARTRSLTADLFARLRARSLTSGSSPGQDPSTPTVDVKTPLLRSSPSRLAGPDTIQLSPRRPLPLRRLSDDTAFGTRPSSITRSRTPTTSKVSFPRKNGSSSFAVTHSSAAHMQGNHGQVNGQGYGIISHSHISTPPRSARRWAKSAHLHELRGRRSRSRPARGGLGVDEEWENENLNANVNGDENEVLNASVNRSDPEFRYMGSPTLGGRRNGLGIGVGKLGSPMSMHGDGMQELSPKLRMPLEPLRIAVPARGVNFDRVSASTPLPEHEVWVDTDGDGEEDGEDTNREEDALSVEDIPSVVSPYHT